ncbi:MAG: methyltransferase domain-containing protein, partial [Rhodospirillaceae bacterium]
RLLDLGCGTGLATEALTKRFDIGEKVGVDLSNHMAAASVGKAIYQQVICDHATEFLRKETASFDLITAADLLMYMGDLSKFMKLVGERMDAGGLFAFTHLLGSTSSFSLTPSGRFVHNSAYVHRMAEDAGLKLLTSAPTTLRFFRKESAPGVVGVFTRPS